MGASHLQVRQRHRLSSPTLRRPACADCRLSESAPQIARCVQQHMSTPNAWTCDGRVPYSLGPASSLPSAALRSGRSSLARCTNPRSGPPQAPVTRRKFAYSASPTLTVWRYCTFAVLWALILAPVWLAVQPNAQITLALATAALLAHLELIDAARDGRGSPGELFNRSRRRPRTSTTGTADNGSWARAWDSRGEDGRGSAACALHERTPSDSCEFAVEGGVRAY